MDPKARLKEIILQYSYEKRPVTLASGRKSDFYFDGKQTSLHPEGSALLAESFLALLQKKFPQAQGVGGPTLGADPLTTALALLAYQRAWDLKAFIVRKSPKGHGTMAWIEGAKHLKPGMRVVLLEDVITSGGSLIKAAKQVREAGLHPLGTLVLVDREEGGKEAIEAEDLKVVSLFKKSDLI